MTPGTESHRTKCTKVAGINKLTNANKMILYSHSVKENAFKNIYSLLNSLENSHCQIFE